jgi:hypothetical protein
VIEIDNFIENFDELESFYKTAEYKDEVNPSDGVVYPHICKDLPESIVHSVMFQLTYGVLGRMPKDPVIFLRKSPEGVDVPHKFHTDNSMGKFSLMLYLQDNDNAGTGFAKHKETGVTSSNIGEESLSKTIKDCNDDSKWQIYKSFKMRKNRAVTFDASQFHVALPIGGFGEAENSRTVLTCFFS